LTRRDLVPGGPPLELQLTGSATADAFLSGRLLDRDGRVPEGVQLFLQASRGGVGSRRVTLNLATGEFLHGPLVPGDYLLARVQPGRPDAALEVTALASGERRVLPDWIVPRGARLVVRVEGSTEARASPAQCRLLAARGFSAVRDVVDGIADFADLAPGDYIVRVNGGAGASEPLDVTIREARDESVTLRLHPAVSVTLRLLLPDRPREPLVIPSAWLSAHGTHDESARVLVPDLHGAPFDWPVSVPPGRYLLRVNLAMDAISEHEVVIAPDPPAGQVLEVLIR
jgi:hypothetical protein